MTPLRRAIGRTVLLGCALGLAAPGRAAAGPEDDQQVRAEAAGFFQAGQAAVKAGRFNDAIYAFEESYRRSPREPVIYVLALAYYEQFAADQDPAKLRRAEQLSRDYFALPDANPERASKLRDRLGRYLLLLHQLDVEAAAAKAVPPPPPPPRTTLVISSPVEGARVSFEDGAEQAVPAVIDTTAGRHAFTVTAAGYAPAQGGADAVAGESVSVQVPLTELPATLVVRGSGRATVAVDGRPVGAAGAPLSVPAGPHRVTVLRRGRYPWQRDLVLERGVTVDVSAPLTVTDQRRASRYVLAGGAALLVVGGTTTLLAKSAQGDAEDLYAIIDGGGSLTEAQRQDYNRALDRRDRWRTTSYVMFGATLAAVTSGALLYVLDNPRLDRGGSPVTPTIGDGTVGVAGRF